MAYASFVADLKKLGLSDKEASVYLSALGLGPSTVQIIARKAKVARATTYLVLEALMKQGLVSQFTEGSKVFFVAESPHHLEILLDQKEKGLDQERLGLQHLMPELLAFMQSTDSRALVRYYEGLEGLRNVRAEMTMRSKPGDLWRQIAPVDHMQLIYGKEDFTYVKQRKAKRIRSQAIFTTKSKEMKKYLLETVEPKWAERKFIDPSKYTSTSGTSIYRDQIVITTFEGKVGGAIIESPSISKMMEEFFDLLWSNLPK